MAAKNRTFRQIEKKSAIRSVSKGCKTFNPAYDISFFGNAKINAKLIMANNNTTI